MYILHYVHLSCVVELVHEVYTHSSLHQYITLQFLQLYVGTGPSMVHNRYSIVVSSCITGKVYIAQLQEHPYTPCTSGDAHVPVAMPTTSSLPPFA